MFFIMWINQRLQLALPHINVLSKMDLLEKYGKLPFNIDYYTEVLDLNYLVQELKGSWYFGEGVSNPGFPKQLSGNNFD